MDIETGEVRRVERGGLLEAATEKLTKNFRQQQGVHKMCADFCHEADGMILLYKQEG